MRRAKRKPKLHRIGVSPAQARMYLAVARDKRRVADVAAELGISRQAAHTLHARARVQVNQLKLMVLACGGDPHRVDQFVAELEHEHHHPPPPAGP